MTINYKLLNIGKNCIILNKEAVFSNVADITIAFVGVKFDKTYVVVFKDEQNIEYKKELKDGKCQLPKEIVATQSVSITLYETKNALIKCKYDCEPLSIADFNARAKTLWELYPDLREFRQKYIEFIQEYEKSITDIKALQGDIALKNTQISTLEASLNSAIEAINKLSERVEFMENNYNPMEV